METASACKRRTNGELQKYLQEPIIQHIQSFMSGKEAAQTSFLSKPWHATWSTRPSLEYDENHKQYLSAFEKKVRRYEKLNLTIKSFRLRLSGSYHHYFAYELVVKAMRMGAVDLDLKLPHRCQGLVLPQEVLGSETLIRLSVTNCKINIVLELKVGPRIKSLILRNACTGGDIIWVIISNCPLIEYLELSECNCLFVPDGGVACTRKRMLVLKPDKPIIEPYQFHYKLKSLLLEKVKIGTRIFDGFSSRFPCLKDLALRHCSGCKA